MLGKQTEPGLWSGGDRCGSLGLAMVEMAPKPRALPWGNPNRNRAEDGAHGTEPGMGEEGQPTGTQS